MPEGHTIHRLARDLGRDLRGHAVAVSSPQGRFSASASSVDGATVEEVEAYGKHLFLWFEAAQVIHVHLGLFGKFKRRPSPPPEPVGQVRMRMEGPAWTWDLAGPTVCRLESPADRDQTVARLGADPLRNDENGFDRFRARLGRSSMPMGRVLLDQKAIAGIGNVYRAELLFLCGIHPDRSAKSLSEDEVRVFWETTVEQLRAGVRRNRIVTTDPAEIGKPVSRMRRADALYAYQREVCRRCAGPITLTEVANRKLWYCPTCQPAHDSRSEVDP